MKRKMETHIICSIVDILEGKEGALENLKKFVNALWEVRTQMHESVVSYNLHFELNHYLNSKKEDRLNFISLPTQTKDVKINLEEKTIEIVNFAEEKSCTIKIDGELSRELENYLCEFYFNDDIKLNLSEITEKYEIGA